MNKATTNATFKVRDTMNMCIVSNWGGNFDAAIAEVELLSTISESKGTGRDRYELIIEAK